MISACVCLLVSTLFGPEPTASAASSAAARSRSNHIDYARLRMSDLLPLRLRVELSDRCIMKVASDEQLNPTNDLLRSSWVLGASLDDF